jgi:hypothetical protein
MTKNDFYAFCYGKTFQDQGMMSFLYRNEPNDYFPTGAKRRERPWAFICWIKRESFMGLTFEEMCRDTVLQDHGELRFVDVYPEGAIEWVCEPGPLRRLWQRVTCLIIGHTVRNPVIDCCRHCGARL